MHFAFSSYSTAHLLLKSAISNTSKTFPLVEQTNLSIWIRIEEDNFSDDIFPLCYRPVFSLTDVFGTWEVILY